MKINFNPKKVISDFAKYSNSTNVVFELGATLIGNILVGVFIGLWLGNLYSDRALFVVIFMLLGLASGFYQVWKLSLRELKKIEESSKKNTKGPNSSGNDNGSDSSDGDA
jgi:ATP synthase protein I